jgi:thiamine pyrophosphate-dependent acetolactate synthase large subunit-like protein
MQAPKNLAIAILDNGSYGETGGQESATARVADLAAVAKAFGIADSVRLSNMADVAAFRESLHRPAAGPRVAVIKIDPTDLPRVLPTRDAVEMRLRLAAALGAQP